MPTALPRAVCISLLMTACGGRTALNLDDAGGADGSGAGGSGGAGGDGGGGSGGGSDEPRSFIVTASLSAQGISIGTVPKEHVFTLHLDPRRLVAIAGENGYLAHAAIASTGDGWRITEPLSLSIEDGFCSRTTLHYKSLTLRLVAGRAEGSVVGDGQTFRDDVIEQLSFRGTFTGVPDDKAPVIGLDSYTGHPFDPVVVRASEPVAEPLTISLLANDGHDAILVPTLSGAGASARWESNVVLRFGESYAVAWSPAVRDLAGNHGEPRTVGPVRTTSDPGLFGDPGFEGPVSAHLEGGVEVVDAAVLPPIAGKRSLFCPPAYVTGRFSARLPAPAGAAAVLMKLRYVQSSAASESSFFAGQLRLAAPGGKPEAAILPGSDGPWTAAGAFWLGPTTDVKLPVPSGTSGEVDLDLSDAQSCHTLPHLGLGLLMDELRVE